MRIVLEYRNPTPSHCGVAIWINGALAGELTLRQDEVVGFQQILADGCNVEAGDSFFSRGNPDPPEQAAVPHV